MQKNSTFPYREEAIPFITVDSKTNKFLINEEAVALINSIKGNIGVIAVAGLYRTGKSYLLNRMILDRSSGFGVGPSINPCTKGLWIWGTPLTGQTADGDPLNILVVDSEGIGALDQDSSHDNRIFSLTVLLSSCFLYNSTGSIDENAIQNLSVIVNITKNIQIKSRPNGSSETEPEEYAKYFPSFVWVLRDFALQLIDTEGRALTSKEYLERTLADQKGTSDSSVQKNKIRKLLRTYFKERDCFTLVRPLTKEENLQNLDKMDLDELRPEFSRQVIALRRYILNKMKPKTMNNKILTGSMYTELTRSYIGAINNGAVPNIENTWSLICKSECYKVMHTAIETYENLLKDVLHNKLPLTPEELKNYHVIGKQRAIGLFKRKAIGDVIDEYLRDLTKEIKLKYFNLKLENEREFNRVSNTFIVKEYSAIERKLKNNEYKAFSEFEREVKLFQSYFLENGPNGPNKRVVINEFLQKALLDASNHFVRSSKQELEFQHTLAQDARRKLEQEINELKNDNSKEKQYLFTKISELEYEKSDLEAREKNLKASLGQLKEFKERSETELKKEWLTEKSQAQRSIEEYKTKLDQAEDNLKEMERRIYLNDSENEKQRALLSQKVQHYETLLEQTSNKEKELQAEVKNLKREHLNQLRESSTKHEALNKDYQTKLEQYQQRISDLENDLANKDQKVELDRKKWRETEFNLQRRVDEAQSTIQKFQKELNEKGDVQLKRYDEYRDQSEKTIETLSEKVKSLEKSLKDKDELLKTTQNSSEKEKSVLAQRTEFLNLQLTEMKSQYNEMKRAYDTTLQCFEGVNHSSSQEESRNIQELKELHQAEIKKLETELESVRKRLSQQVQEVTEKYNDLELSSKLKNTELTQEIQNLQEKLEVLEQERRQLVKQVKVSDGKKIKMVEEVEGRYLERIKDLEEEMEDKNRKSERQLRDIQEKSEESLLQLRNFYDLERERLEKRIMDEKEKSDKKLNNMIEEYENKLKDEQTLHEEELENLKDELQELEAKSTALTQEYESELTLKQQAIESLENYVKETKESLANIHSSNASALEHHLNSFGVERAQLVAKIETLNAEISKRDQEISGLVQAKEFVETNLVRKENVLETNTKELTSEKISLQKTLEETRAKLQEANNKFLEKKVEFSRELALTQQKNEFLHKRTEELQKQIEETVNVYEEKLRNQKEELTQKFQEEFEQINAEKVRMSAEYEKLRRSLDNTDLSHQDRFSNLEKEKAILEEKFRVQEEKMKEANRKLTAENQSYMTELSQLKDKFSSEKRSLNESLQTYKAQCQEFEHKYNEVTTSYEKDQALWKGKFQFLENQKEEAKSNLADVQKKFELTLQQIQKKRTIETQESEAAQNSKVSILEKRHQGQLLEINENHQKEVQALHEKIKKIEKELKSLKDKQHIDNHSTAGSQSYVERKLTEMYENEKRLQAELESTKADRDTKILEHQKLLDKERGALKGRIADYEQRIRELEAKKNSVLFDFEKERMRWQQEKDHLSIKNKELLDDFSTLEKRKDALLRENEKLKSDYKMNKKSMTSTGPFYGKSNTAVKMKPASPDRSRDSPSSLDKNLNDITNKKQRFDANYTGHISMRTGSTSDDEGQF